MRFWRNEKGNIATILCVMVIISAVCGMIYLAVSGSSGNREIASDPKGAFEALRSRVDQAMNNPATVAVSVERNPNAFACLFSAQGECLNKGGVFLYYETVEPRAQPISQLTQNTGFGYDGIACTGYPNAECAFHVETSWQPICSSGRCEGTKSFKMRSRVTFNSGDKEHPPLDWSREEMYSPTLKLSEAALCVRDAKVWVNGECISADLAAQRNVASSNKTETIEGSNPSEEIPVVEQEGQRDPQENMNNWVCPNTIVLQGQEFYMDILQPGRGQVQVPAVNGCPNVADLFIFQCVQKSPAAFEGEGQWVQVEAQMAPPCQGAEGVQGGEPYYRQ